MRGTFDLLEVKIKNQTIHGRPIEWDREFADAAGNDAAGEPSVPSRYMTTCPFCSQLIKFRPEEIYDGNNLRCSSCDAHTPPIDKNPEGVQMPAIVDEMQDAMDPVGAFIDPVEAGLVNTSNYIE